MLVQGLSQTQELRQEQILAPQQIQSLEILLAPLLELQTKISQELETNPTLEQVSPGGEDLAGDVLSEAESVQKENSGEEDRQLDDDGVSDMLQLADSWHEHLPDWTSVRTTPEDAEKRQHFFDSLTVEQSLQEQLLEQLRLSEADGKMKRLAELIIGSIDDSGYLRSIMADLATVAEVGEREMRKALALVQSFDPPGIGAENLKDCLLLQLRRKGMGNSKLARLVADHLDDIASNKLPSVARKLGVSMAELNSLIEEMRSLNPYPGSAIAPNSPIFILPEVTVEEKDGDFSLKANNEHLPKLRISQLYLKLLDDPGTNAETREYIREKLLKSKALLKSISQRQSTITQIAEVILDSQHGFFSHGIEHMRPMTMQQVADKLGLHETTVSRAIANKYMQTPFGLFEFKFFFSSGYQSQDGENISSRGVMEKIKDLIAREDPRKPLSDLRLAKMLDEQGLRLARRTVAKYREEMGIPSSHLRKEYE
ncbi:MAG: RNA polymerase factor sigma-54 [Victivallales bacterium]|nr:RNA polymerase factor sigma-54 [Victivallales bacterium]